MLEITTLEVALTAEGTLLEVLRIVDVKDTHCPGPAARARVDRRAPLPGCGCTRGSHPGLYARVAGRMSVREGKESIKMIRVAVEIREGALTHRTRVTAPSIERALKIAGGGKPGRRVSLVLPIEPKTFFVTEDPSRKEAA